LPTINHEPNCLIYICTCKKGQSMQLLSFAILAMFLSACGITSAGPPGPQGLQGGRGNQGVPGNGGTNCTVATLGVSVATPNGGSLISCTDGTSSVVLNGSNGADGTDGSPGTVVTPMQFCPSSFVQSYPSTFAESGICIDNVMYGVYSANGGFLAALPPGQYSSDGINASCTFTIGANCQISD
jgi:hypothetical protein